MEELKQSKAPLNVERTLPHKLQIWIQTHYTLSTSKRVTIPDLIKYYDTLFKKFYILNLKKKKNNIDEIIKKKKFSLVHISKTRIDLKM